MGHIIELIERKTELRTTKHSIKNNGVKICSFGRNKFQENRV